MLRTSSDVIVVAILASLFFVSIGLLELLALNYRSDTCTLITAARTLGERGIVRVHFSPLILLFKPLCSLCPYTVVVLSILQGLALGLTTAVVYLIAKNEIKEWAKFAVMIFLLAPPIYGPATFGVHVESFMLFFLALMYYYGVVKDDYRRAYASALLALGFKETALIPATGLFLWRVAKGRAKRSEVLMIIGAFLLIVLFFVYMLVSTGRLGLASQRYFFLSENVKPEDVLSSRKIVYVAYLALTYPLLALSVWSKEFLLFLPKLLNDMLMSSRKTFTHFDFAYQYSGIVAIAAIVTTILMAKKVGPSWLKSNLVTAAFAFLTMSAISPIPLIVIYSNLWGIPMPLPPYPAYSTTYRPILLIQTQCFWKAFVLYHEATKIVETE